MASINGVSLKKVKQFMGRDGYGLNADVYLNGKKIGFYLDEGNGGCSSFYPEKDGDEDALRNAEKEYFTKANKKMMTYCEVGDNIIMELTELMDYEKKFKSAIKKGFVALGIKHIDDFNSTIYSFKVMPSAEYIKTLDKFFGDIKDFTL